MNVKVEEARAIGTATQRTAQSRRLKSDAAPVFTPRRIGLLLRIVAGCAVCAYVAPLANADTLFVDDDADPLLADGLSWATAFPGLRDALDAARAEPGRFDAIWIAEGIYKPAGPGGDRLANYDMVDGVALRGGFAGNETAAEDRPAFDEPGAPQTILSGDLNGDDIPGDLETNKGDNSIELVVAQFGVQSLEIDRLVIEGGYRDQPGSFSQVTGTAIVSVALANTIRDCVIRDNNITAGQGGNVILGGAGLQSGTIVSSLFVNNHAQGLGGALIVAGVGSSLTIDRCRFEQNASTDGGGALFARSADVSVAGSHFVGNSVDSAFSVLNRQIYGGAALIEQSSAEPSGQTLILEDSEFIGNSVRLESEFLGDAGGGAVAAESLDRANVTNCTFQNNSVVSTTQVGSVVGGALALYDIGFRPTEITVTDSRFTDNTIESNDSVQGSALYASAIQRPLVLESCRFENNSAIDNGNFFPSSEIPRTGATRLRGFSVDSTIDITDCHWTDNTFELIAGERETIGAGALFAEADTVSLTRSSIRSTMTTLSESEHLGPLEDPVAGAAWLRGGIVLVDSCEILGNRFDVVLGPSGSLRNLAVTGTPLVVEAIVAKVHNSLIAKNTSPRAGGLELINRVNEIPSNGLFTNTTIAENEGGLSASSGTEFQSTIRSEFPVAIVNSIIWGNSDASHPDATDALLTLAPGSTIDHSIIENLDPAFPGVANTDADPLFVDPASGDFRPAFGSPAIDSGDSTRVPTDLTLDLDGNPRVLDDPATLDTGIAATDEGPVVDRGALEFVPAPICPADLAHPFGVLDLHDIVAFITAFQDQQPEADLAEPFGIFDSGDIASFVSFMLGVC